jgi:hypothetical protein
MEGYSLKIDGTLKHFTVDKNELIATLEKQGMVNYKKPEIGPTNWVSDSDTVEYPYWGMVGVFGEIVKVELKEIA